MHFLRLFLAFIQKLCLLSFHFPKINKKGGGVGIRAGGGGLENFSKINKREGTIIRYSRVCSILVRDLHVLGILIQYNGQAQGIEFKFQW